MGSYTTKSVYICDECNKEYNYIDDVLECCNPKQKIINSLKRMIEERKIKSGRCENLLQIGDVEIVIDDFFKDYSITQDGGKDE